MFAITKRLSSGMLAVLFAVLIAVTALSPVVDAQRGGNNNTPPGNNGTVKVGAPNLTGDIDNSNEPKIEGCVLRVEWFGFDKSPRTSTVSFAAQSPTTANQLVSPVGVQNFTFTGQGQGGVRDAFKDYTLVFTGEPSAQGYKVKVTVTTDGSQGNDTKSKVFWMTESCRQLATVTPAAVTFTEPTCETQGSYTIPTSTGVDYKVNNVTKAAGTYTVPNGQSVTVVAVAKSGYALTGTTQWSKTFTAPENCEGPEFLFRFNKLWAGAEIDLTGVQVTFNVGTALSWKPGDPSVPVENGQTLSPLTETVTGLPTNCSYTTDLPQSVTLSFPIETRFETLTLEILNPNLTYTETEDGYLATLNVTNTVTCTPGRGGETPQAPPVVTTAAVTTPTPPAQVAAVPVGAANTGAGAMGSIAGLFGSLSMVAAGFIARRYTIV